MWRMAGGCQCDDDDDNLGDGDERILDAADDCGNAVRNPNDIQVDLIYSTHKCCMRAEASSFQRRRRNSHAACIISNVPSNSVLLFKLALYSMLMSL